MEKTWYVFIMKRYDGSKVVAIDHNLNSIEENDEIIDKSTDMYSAYDLADKHSKKLGIEKVKYFD